MHTGKMLTKWLERSIAEQDLRAAPGHKVSVGQGHGDATKQK